MSAINACASQGRCSPDTFGFLFAPDGTRNVTRGAWLSVILKRLLASPTASTQLPAINILHLAYHPDVELQGAPRLNIHEIQRIFSCFPNVQQLFLHGLFLDASIDSHLLQVFSPRLLRLTVDFRRNGGPAYPTHSDFTSIFAVFAYIGIIDVRNFGDIVADGKPIIPCRCERIQRMRLDGGHDNMSYRLPLLAESWGVLTPDLRVFEALKLRPEDLPALSSILSKLDRLKHLKLSFDLQSDFADSFGALAVLKDSCPQLETLIVGITVPRRCYHRKFGGWYMICQLLAYRTKPGTDQQLRKVEFVVTAETISDDSAPCRPSTSARFVNHVIGLGPQLQSVNIIFEGLIDPTSEAVAWGLTKLYDYLGRLKDRQLSISYRSNNDGSYPEPSMTIMGFAT